MRIFYNSVSLTIFLKSANPFSFILKMSCFLTMRTDFKVCINKFPASRASILFLYWSLPVQPFTAMLTFLSNG